MRGMKGTCLPPRGIQAREAAFAECDDSPRSVYAQETREPGICLLMQQLGKEINSLGELARELEGRLDRVIQPRPDSDGSEAGHPQPIESPMANGLRTLIAQVERIHCNLSDVIDRLEC